MASRRGQINKLFWLVSGGFLLMVLFILLLVPALSDGLRLDTGIYLLVTLSVMIWLIVAAGRINREMVLAEAKDYAIEPTTKFLAQWSVDRDLWARYSRYVFIDSLKTARFTAVAMAVLLGVIAALISLPRLELTRGLGIIGIVSISTFFLVWGMGVLVVRHKYRRARAIIGADIQFGPRLVVRNGTLIRLEGMGIWLKKFELVEEAGMWILHFSVKQGHASGGKGFRHYSFPVPASKRHHIEKLKQHYEPLLGLSASMK